MITSLFDSHLRTHLTKQEAVNLLLLMHKCASCAAKRDLDDIIEELGALLPFDYYACVTSGLEPSGSEEHFNVVTTNYPDEWVRLYTAGNYQRIDPVALEFFENSGLQYWEDTYKKRPPDAKFLESSRGFGLRLGYTCGIRNPSGSKRGLVSVSGDGLVKCGRHIAVLDLITPHLNQAMERVSCSEKIEVLPSLSERELEVLKWVAHGKTTWETGVILGLSERTVKFHVVNIMRKLNATSRTHAAAIACGLGIMDLD